MQEASNKGMPKKREKMNATLKLFLIMLLLEIPVIIITIGFWTITHWGGLPFFFLQISTLINIIYCIFFINDIILHRQTVVIKLFKKTFILGGLDLKKINIPQKEIWAELGTDKIHYIKMSNNK